MGTVYAKEPGSSKFQNEQMFSQEMPRNNNEPKSADSFNQSSFRKGRKIVKNIDFKDMKARVDKIHVDGLIRTKDDIIQPQVKELFKAQDFLEVIMNSLKVRKKLESLGCFGNIQIHIDTSKGPEATPNGVEVTFEVIELKRVVGGISTMFGNNEGSLIVNTTAPNLFGRGERLQVEYSHGSKSSTNVSISLMKPLIDSRLHTVLTSTIFSTSNDFPWSGFKQRDTGLLMDVTVNPSESGTLKHQFQYEAAVREINCSKQASFRVREQCGPNLKSSLRYILSIDKRDGKIFPTTGNLIQFSTEIAGLGGDIGFIKNELSAQSNWTPHECFTFQVGLQSGFLKGISNDLKINLADHFFLGGPMNLRGFDMRGCGPRHDGNAIGGNIYWATALHLYTPLPFGLGHNGIGDSFKLHTFVNAGNLSNFNFKLSNNYEENMKIFTENVRCSIGTGLAMQLGNVARVELNFVKPLCNERYDVIKQVQFGIGVQYL